MIEIIRRFVSKALVSNLPKEREGNYAYAYQCSFPIESPEYKRPQEVMAWYAGLDQKQKLEFKKTGGFVISQLKVALKDVVINDDTYSRGEVVEEVDSYKFDFAKASWVKCEK